LSLTIAYITARKDSKFDEWFLPSLSRQIGRDEDIKIIKIDRYASDHWNTYPQDPRLSVSFNLPKPNVWSGQHKLTSIDWFSVASSRNSALCLCKTSHIAYVDDLSVLQPGWLNAVMEAAEKDDTITCGAYQKVRNLKVENGIAVSYDEWPGGIDNRMQISNQTVAPCTGQWLYGCSLVAPVEALLSVDGWPESICDGLGFEDCGLGLVLQNAGYKFIFDKRMMTLESDEHHFMEEPMKRSDHGVSPNDKSHAALNIFLQSKTFDNGFGEGGIRALRERILAGEPFPIQKNPCHEWFTGKHLSEL
jgi:hypothetical protein